MFQQGQTPLSTLSILQARERLLPAATTITPTIVKKKEKLIMSTMSIARAAVLGGAIAFAALAGGAAQSEAAGFKNLSSLKTQVEQSEVHKVGRKFRRFRRFDRRRGFVFNDNGCGFYKQKWHQTGFFFWKKKYFLCKGWW